MNISLTNGFFATSGKYFFRECRATSIDALKNVWSYLKQRVDSRKSFTLTKTAITSNYTLLETVQLLSETFLATSNNKWYINQNDIFSYHFSTYSYMYKNIHGLQRFEYHLRHLLAIKKASNNYVLERKYCIVAQLVLNKGF